MSEVVVGDLLNNYVSEKFSILINLEEIGILLCCAMNVNAGDTFGQWWW